ncbi:MAG TPA: DUF2125 domain-containing protein [Pseudolabrys sp.]|nr:DUF2125 domain-containing protein [Pseudolabrys sp.]
MAADPNSLQGRRRTGRRYVILVFVVLALAAGWAGLWKFAAGKAQETLDGWRAREARVGRVYTCGTQTIAGFPFRIELMCDRASAVLQQNHPPLELKLANIMVAAQVYQPTVLTSEYMSPLTAAEPGHQPTFIANWKLARSSVSGTPNSPESVAIMLESATLDRMNGSARENMVRAKRIEIHGRMLEGSARSNPVIEVLLNLKKTSAPAIHPAATAPVDVDLDVVLRGLKDFAPKPWPDRFREIQAANGRIEVNKARVQQGETIAVGSGTLGLNAQGKLQGQLNITVAGLEPFLKNIGADRMVQSSPTVDRLAGTLDRLMPGLGGIARQQAGANLSAGISLLGQPATLEGKRAVSLPLRFDEGAIFLGPIPIGKSPTLF